MRFHDDNGNGAISSGELLSTHDYYPFGMEWNAGSYRYTYNGKENNTELGLDLLDYGARMYDPVIARFTGVDPISNEFPYVSTIINQGVEKAVKVQQIKSLKIMSNLFLGIIWSIFVLHWIYKLVAKDRKKENSYGYYLIFSGLFFSLILAVYYLSKSF